MTIKQAAEKLKISPQLLRVWASSEKGCPFVEVIREGQRNTYYVSEDRMRSWCEGRITE